MDAVLLWVAQGFGSGWMRFGPGTFGSLVGLGWTALLVCTGNWSLYGVGCAVGLACSVPLSGRAERILDQKDPGSVVIDEMAAMPVCFAAWLGLMARSPGEMPVLRNLVAGHGALWVLGIFLAFRLFDVVKPWPVRQSQALPGGWGITIDDFLAAVYVNVVTVLVWKLVGN